MSSPTDNPSSAPSHVPVAKPVVLPPGYIWVNGTIQIDPQQAERIQQLFREYAAKR